MVGYILVIFIILFIIISKLKDNNNLHLKLTELFYRRGLSDDSSKSWGLTFGYWNKDTKTYEEATYNLYKILFDNMNIIQNQSVVISVGCGMGNELIYMFDNYRPKRIYAVDITYKNVERARNLVKQKKLEDYITIIYGSGTKLTQYFKNRNFATHVYSVEAINNMPSFTDFISGANSLLKQGGILAFADGFMLEQQKTPIPYLETKMVSITWSIHNSNYRPFRNVLKDLANYNFQTVNKLDITDHVWKGYTDYKIKNYEEDITNRGNVVNAKIFKYINEYLAYYTKKYDIKYLIYIGKKIKHI